MPKNKAEAIQTKTKETHTHVHVYVSMFVSVYSLLQKQTEEAKEVKNIRKRYANIKNNIIHTYNSMYKTRILY